MIAFANLSQQLCVHCGLHTVIRQQERPPAGCMARTSMARLAYDTFLLHTGTAPWTFMQLVWQRMLSREVTWT